MGGCFRRVLMLVSSLLTKPSSPTDKNSPQPAANAVTAAGRGSDTVAGSAPTGSMGKPPVEPVPGRIGRYRVTGVLGHGGMGVVYRAEDPQLERTVAIKVLSANLSSDVSFR